MHSLDGNLITAALQRSFVPSCKKKINIIDDHLIASARRVLSTKIEYVHCPQYSATEYLEKLKSKYTVLKSNKEFGKKAKKKKKKRNKNRQSENSGYEMKNTELSGQDQTLPDPKVVLFSPDDVQLGWKGNLPVGSGFVNMGTTCYINSTLQVSLEIFFRGKLLLRLLVLFIDKIFAIAGLVSCTIVCELVDGGQETCCCL